MVKAVESVAAPPPITLLADDPSESDDFAGKAHQKVAQAIADLIRRERGGAVIGLEGSWGSGKSTVVTLLCADLANAAGAPTADRPETHSIIFDAWAHQGDPLRRAFLESVVDELENAEWLQTVEAATFRTRLSGRMWETETTTTPRLTWEGRAAAGSAVLLPLGLALFTNDWAQYHRLSQIIGLFLLLLPLLLVAVFALAKYASITFGGTEQRPGNWRRRVADLDPFGFFAKQQSEVTTSTENITQREPTSVEFERLFGDLLDAVLNDKRRLLVVLDNLDRVDASDARGVLATMRTFTNSRADTSGDKVWTLIPYDRSGLDRLWASTTTDGTGEGAPKGATAAAFVEKVFQAHFETPPLILSDWREYLGKLIREAIPSITDEDVASVRGVRAQYRGKNGSGTTPRQLKQFVNQIALIAGRRVGIPLNHIGGCPVRRGTW